MITERTLSAERMAELRERIAKAMWNADGGKDKNWPSMDDGEDWNTNGKAFWRKCARAAIAEIDASSPTLPDVADDKRVRKQERELLDKTYMAAKTLDIWLVHKAQVEAEFDCRSDYRFYMDDYAAKLDEAIQAVEDFRRDQSASSVPTPTLPDAAGAGDLVLELNRRLVLTESDLRAEQASHDIDMKLAERYAAEIESLQGALTSAIRAGIREGREEAAKVCEAVADTKLIFPEMNCAEYVCAALIRALPDPPAGETT